MTLPCVHCDEILTPPTPSLSAYRDTPSDDELFRYAAQVQFTLLSGIKSNWYAVDEITSYGSLIDMALKFLSSLGLEYLVTIGCDAQTGCLLYTSDAADE